MKYIIILQTVVIIGLLSVFFSWREHRIISINDCTAILETESKAFKYDAIRAAMDRGIVVVKSDERYEDVLEVVEIIGKLTDAGSGKSAKISYKNDKTKQLVCEFKKDNSWIITNWNITR